MANLTIEEFEMAANDNPVLSAKVGIISCQIAAFANSFGLDLRLKQRPKLSREALFWTEYDFVHNHKDEAPVCG